MSAGELRERLQRLRREIPPTADGREDGDAVRERLDAHAARLARRAAHADPLSKAVDVGAGEHSTVGDPRELSSSVCDGVEVLARESSFAPDFRHGDWSLSEIAAAERELFALLTDQQHLAEVDLGQCVYLDTETTGLSGGAGTYVFLIGLGTFEHGRFHVWQGFLREPAGERALLREAARRIAARPHIVSFFGKSFDRHRLEDRMRCHGLEAPCFDRAHLDLFHPLRRLYKGALANARLRTLETELCGVRRDNDLSGAHAPRAWFDFMHGRAHELERVFRHNLEDVLSLVVLAAHLGASARETHSAIDAAPIAGPGAARARALACAYASHGRFREALSWFDHAFERAHAHDATLVHGDRGDSTFAHGAGSGGTLVHGDASDRKFERLLARTRRALGLIPGAE